MRKDRIEGLAKMLAEFVSPEMLESLTNGPWKPNKPDGEMVADLLGAIAKENMNSNPYQEGDLITPIEDCNMKGHGRPFIVEEVFNLTQWIGDPPESSRKANLLVAVLIGDDLLRYKVHHSIFEPFVK